MEKYNYKAQEVRDNLDYIEENNIEITEENREEIAGQLRDDLWEADSAAIPLAQQRPRITLELWDKGAEWADVTIRCYLLGECIEDAIDIAIKKREKYDR